MSLKGRRPKSSIVGRHILMLVIVVCDSSQRKERRNQSPKELYIVDRIKPGGSALPRKRLEELALRHFGGVKGHRQVETAGEFIVA